MKKIFIKICTLILCISLIFSFASCTQSNNDDDNMDAYLEGVTQGREDLFLSLFNASGIDFESLFEGDVWDTNHFSLTFTDENNNSGTYLKYNMTLKNTTMEECFEREEMFFYIFDMADENFVLEYDDYYIFAIVENDYPLGYNAKGTVPISNEEAVSLIMIIVIDGHLYSAAYYLLQGF